MQEVVAKISNAEEKAAQIIEMAQEKAAQIKRDAAQQAEEIAKNSDVKAAEYAGDVAEKAKAEGEALYKRITAGYEEKCAALKKSGEEKVKEASEYIKQSII